MSPLASLYDRLIDEQRALALDDPGLATAILQRTDGPHARLALKWAWLLYRFAPEHSEVAAVHVRLSLLTMKEGHASVEDLVKIHRTIGGNERELQRLLDAPDDVLRAEVDEALARPRWRPRQREVEELAKWVQPGEKPEEGVPSSAAEPAPTVVREVNDALNQESDRARALVRARDLALASADDTQLAAPHRATLAALAAEACLELDDTQRALALSERAIALDPDSNLRAVRERRRSTILMFLHRFDEAEAAARLSLSYPSDDIAEAYRILGVALEARAKRDDAESAYTQALAHGLEPSRVWKKRHVALDARFALRVWRRAFDLAHEDLDVITELFGKVIGGGLRVEAFLAEGKVEAALSSAESLIPLDAKRGAFARGRVELARGNAAAAERDLSRAVEAEPENPLPILWRARARALGGDLLGAFHDLGRALRPEVWDEDWENRFYVTRPFASRADVESTRVELKRRALEQSWVATHGLPETIAAARTLALSGKTADALRALIPWLNDPGLKTDARAGLKAILSLEGREDEEIESLRREAGQKL